ncbi:sulfate adenylyltransferase subunit CysD [Pseudothauera lacus]|uniref:Sulfate adenylyltransferase subunit 2 n=2 Tax=Pseudothauera lacus TaxID=2136175 RepID=A0A2T4IK42_9RHOO|nr:sulfate adenylyltransferase subunit CysD [Pseudothauera lacus]
MAHGARHLSPEALNERRKLAVRLRLSGQTLAEVARLADLSVPTVLAAMRAFENGGWDAIAVRQRGRDEGSGKLLSPQREHQLLQSLAKSAGVWTESSTGELIRTHFGIEAAARTVSRLLTRWGIKSSAARPEESVSAPATLRLHARAHEIVWQGGPPHAAGGETLRFLIMRDSRNRLTFTALDLQQPLHALARLTDHYRTQAGERPADIHLSGFDLTRIAPAALPAGVTLHSTPLPSTRTLLPPLPAAAPADQPSSHTQAPQGRPGAPDADGMHKAAAVTKPTSSTSIARQALMKSAQTLTHLQRLEAESIHIMREVVAEADNPVMLYSIGKDSAVMLHLARKAFHPAVPPFPLLHVDTRWKFRDMYAFRDRMAQETGMDLLVHINPEGIEKNINPFTHGSAIHTDIMKTEGLKQALDQYGFDAAFGGARRDEEKSRAKERVFSFRSAQHRWDPKNQRPELWKLYNARKHKGESIRVFPLSNWTELDIWQYIYLENIPIVPLYLSAVRPVVERDGTLIMVDDERMPLKPGEVPMMKKVRFRTLGCYPLTGAIESTADTLPAIIQEMLLTRTSERQGRVIDHDSAASMEKKKQEGYF